MQVSTPGHRHRSPRIAVIQHGDYASAIALRDSGAGEPYFGMYNSVGVLDELLNDHPSLVISLDAPQYQKTLGRRTLVGLPGPRHYRPMPRCITFLRWAARIRWQLVEFEPTHILIRCGGLLAWRLLTFAKARDLNCAVILAGTLVEPTRTDWLIVPLLVRRLNDPLVRLIGNHKMPATQSLLDAGVDPSKTVAYDWPGARRPQDYQPRHLSLVPGESPTLLYIGNMISAKGVADVIDAIARLRAGGPPVRLIAAGDGEEFLHMKARAAQLNLAADCVLFLGRVSNDQAFELMRRCTFICVPSRQEFPEGMPLTLTEALASRTPVILTDHPVFHAAFTEGEGVCFYRAGDPVSLTTTVKALLNDPQRYAAISASSADAFARVECPTAMGELFQRWAKTFDNGERSPA